jgi:hypothetical protein
MRKHTWYIQESGVRGGRGETVAEGAQLSLETTTSFFSREISTGRNDILGGVHHGISWARRKGLGARAMVPNRTNHLIREKIENITPWPSQVYHQHYLLHLFQKSKSSVTYHVPRADFIIKLMFNLFTTCGLSSHI